MYTDGAYSSTINQMGIGIVFLKNSTLILEYSRMYKDGTNNIAELGAVIIGLRFIRKSVDSLTIVSDSMYVIGCATKGWKRKKNIKLWEEFDRQYSRVKELCPNITFVHTKGHNGDKWNEYCDKLAVNASRQIG